MHKRILGERLYRWALFLSQFDYSIEHRSGQSNKVADALSRYPFEHDEDELYLADPDDWINCVQHCEKDTEWVKNNQFNFSLILDKKELEGDRDFRLNTSKQFDKESVEALSLEIENMWALRPIPVKKVYENPVEDQKLRDHIGDIEFEKLEFSRTEQNRDRYLRTMISVLKNEIPDESVTDEEVSLLQNRSLLYEVVFGVLYYVDKTEGDRLKMVIPEQLRPELVYHFHNSEIGGHIKGVRLFNKMKALCFWEGMRTDVFDYCANCVECIRIKQETKVRSNLKPLPIPNSPWDVVGIDIVGPLPMTTENKNQYLIVILDLFSRWVEAIPVKNTTTETIADAFLNRCLAIHGQPKVLISDRGPQFTSGMWAQLCEHLEIKHKLSLAYHPQTNGAVENMNKEILKMLKAFALKKPNSWDKNLELLLFSHRTTPHSSTGISPFEMNRGKLARIPATSWFVNPPDLFLESDPSTYLNDLRRTLADINRISKEEITRAKNEQSEYYNRRAKQNPFKVGMMVMCRDYLSAKYQNKLSTKLTGPFLIEKLEGGRPTCASLKVRRNSRLTRIMRER
jgi:hypothetical protein